MIGWIVVIILGIIAAFLLKLSHVRHRVTLAFLIILALFFVATLGIVTAKHKMDLSTTSGFFDAVKVYWGWLANGFQNLKAITGNVVKMDWTSANGTFVNKTGK